MLPKQKLKQALFWERRKKNVFKRHMKKNQAKTSSEGWDFTPGLETWNTNNI